jgi:hypothetical protein
MRMALNHGVFVLAIAALLLSVSPGPLVAQQTSPTWLVVTFKLQMVVGKPMVQVTGPFSTGGMCEAMLKFAQEGLKGQGIETASMVCRNDVTVVVPDQGAPPPASPAPAPAEGH